MTRPTLKQVRELLGQKVTGRNDNRVGGGRIKLDTNLERAQEVDLENKLSCLYPKLIITVADDVLRDKEKGDIVVTVINYRDLELVKEKRQQPKVVEETVTPPAPRPSREKVFISNIKSILQAFKNLFK